MIESNLRSSDGGARAADGGGTAARHGRFLDLALRVADPESVGALAAIPEGPERDAHALRALRIGLLAMSQAEGVIDADAVKREGEQILARMQMALNGHQSLVQERLDTVLREYFDPESGRFAERVQRLVEKDGELERVLRSQVGGDESPLQKTLAEHVGPDSVLMRLLSPSDAGGLLASIDGAMQSALTGQRDRILDQFSLDNPEGALARLVRDLKSNHADISDTLERKVGDVVGEFSLDNDDSALSKLVQRVDSAQRKISAEFSLDQETSALARLRREMLTVLESSAKRDASFRESVMDALGELRGRRDEADRSTRHGLTFEQALMDQLHRRAQAVGDVATSTGQKTGIVPNSKVGDAVWELGPEHAAAGARIVIEAKESKSVSLADARLEIEVGRKNRGAAVGLYIFSAKTAPEGLQPFQRLGQDVFVVWDAEDPETDMRLEAGVETARALCTRAAGQRASVAADFEQIDRSILALEKQIGALEDIRTWAQTIDKSNEKILDRVRKSQKQIHTHVSRLQEAVEDLKDA